MRIAVIGQGSAGRRFLKNLNELNKNIETHSFPSSKNKKKINVKTNYLHKDLDNFNDYYFDRVIIASPSSYHFSHLRIIKDKNLPILIEKPVCSSSKQIQNIRNLNFSNLIVAYCFRFNAAARKVKKEIKKLGKIHNVISYASSYLPDWRSTPYRKSVSANKKLGGGVLLELSHEIDYLIWLFGGMDVISSKICNTNTLDINVEDCADAFFETKNNTKIFLHLDFMQKRNERFLIVFGEKGKISWNLITDEVFYDDKIIFSKKQNQQNMFFDMTKSFINRRNFSEFASIEESFEVVSLIDEIKALSKN